MTCSAADLGMTGWCSTGRHEQCAHRAGGQQERGVWMPECYVTIPIKGKRVVTLSQAALIRPSHVYRCPCECHRDDRLPAGQLPLFEVA